MPTIELVSLECQVIPELPLFSSFAFIAENDSISHRGLFQPEFDEVGGVIVHLGNKDFENDKDGGFFAGDLIDWPNEGEIIIPEIDEQWSGEDQDFHFKFDQKVIPELLKLFSILSEASPINEILFSTDYQFGPKEKEIKSDYTIAKFLKENERHLLRWNCLYRISIKIN